MTQPENDGSNSAVNDAFSILMNSYVKGLCINSGYSMKGEKHVHDN